MAGDAERLLKRLAERARREQLFVGHALSIYQESKGLSKSELARFLGCAVSSLDKLALCTSPTGDPERRRTNILAIAALGSVDPDRLGQVLSAGDAMLRHHDTQQSTPWDTSTLRRAARHSRSSN